jgi:MFS family permease
VAEGGSVFDSSMLGAVALLPSAILGLHGGAIADSFPRRRTLIAIYILQALLCVFVPLYWGTAFWALAFLIWAINLLGQVSGPSEQAMTPLVARDRQTASANACLSLSSNLGAGITTAIVAPALVILLGLHALFFVAGAMLLAAAFRVSRITPIAHTQTERSTSSASVRSALRWLAGQPGVVLVGTFAIVAGVGSVVLQALAAKYVAEVLKLNAAATIYVFAPMFVGLLFALATTPFLIRWIGERRCALIGLVIVSTTLGLFGLVSHGLNPIVEPINPLHVLSVAGLDVGANVRTAALLALPLGAGVALTGISSQTYVNRNVPAELQGRVFAILTTTKNALAMVLLFTLGIIASGVGVSVVLLLSPVFLYALYAALRDLAQYFERRQSPRIGALGAAANMSEPP